MDNGSALELRIKFRNYYTKFCEEVLSRIAINSECLKALQNINPKNMGPSVAQLVRAFPDLVANLDVGLLDVEWRSVIQQEFVSPDIDVEQFWAEIFELKNALGEFVYPSLESFVGAILSLPHSSACAERIFSRVSLIKNKLRNRLEVPTVNSIMLSTELLNNVPSHEWLPPKNVIDVYHKY